MTDLTLTAIQALPSWKQEVLGEKFRQTLNSYYKRNNRITNTRRQLETDPDFERKQDESEH